MLLQIFFEELWISRRFLAENALELLSGILLVILHDTLDFFFENSTTFHRIRISLTNFSENVSENTPEILPVIFPALQIFFKNLFRDHTKISFNDSSNNSCRSSSKDFTRTHLKLRPEIPQEESLLKFQDSWNVWMNFWKTNKRSFGIIPGGIPREILKEFYEKWL